MTLRERKKAKTREALAEAALELFAAKGFEATTVDDIAVAAEVSRRTFFRYFPSKESVLFPDRERRLEIFQGLIREARAGESPIETVRRAMLVLADDYEAARQQAILQQRIVEASPTLLAYDFELDQHWEATITDALAGVAGARRSRRRDRTRARLMAGAFMGVIRATLREWYASNGELDLTALGEEAFALVRDGIANESATTAPARRRTRRPRQEPARVSRARNTDQTAAERPVSTRDGRRPSTRARRAHRSPS